MKRKQPSKLKNVVIGALVLLILAGAVWGYHATRQPTWVSEVQASATDYPAVNDQPQQLSIGSQQRLEFTAEANGRGAPASFNVSVWTTNGSEIPLGEFGFVLRPIEQIGPHDSKTEKFIDYIIPVTWNSSQKLTEKVLFKEIERNPVRAKIANEPLFRRGIDYDDEVPFAEIEIQVDLVNYYTDTNQASYVAWVRIAENEKAFDIKKIVVRGNS